MTNTIKQILGEAIPGSTDTDVTADEFLSSGPRTIDHGDGITQVFDEKGDQFWYRNGKQHRDNDLPAIIWADGTQIWYRNGKRHRDNDLPAIIWANGAQEWYRNGILHRDGDLPAVIGGNGSQFWFCNGKRHRDGDKPVEVHADQALVQKR